VYTIDTSVFLRDFDVRDPEHASCHALLRRLAADAIPIVVPAIVLAEIAGAISRERRDPIAGRLAVEALRAQPHIRLISVNDTLAQEAAELAADYTLRGTVIALFAAARTGVEPLTLWQRLGLPSFVVLALPNMALTEIVEQVV
jgi:predicted nucleic acid-binding protein